MHRSITRPDRRALSQPPTKADLLWTSQEGSPDFATAFRGHTATYAHSVSPTGLLAGTINADWVFAPSNVVIDRLQNPHTWLFRPPVELDDHPPRDGSAEHVLFFNPIEEKGLQVALDTARALPDSLFFFAEGWWPPDGIADWPPNVFYRPRTNQPGHLYNQASVVLVPSRVEDASPRVLIEASMHRCPALGSPRGGIPEYLTEWQLSPDDPETWAYKTRILSTEPDVRQQLVQAQIALIGEHLANPFHALHLSGILASLDGKHG